MAINLGSTFQDLIEEVNKAGEGNNVDLSGYGKLDGGNATTPQKWTGVNKFGNLIVNGSTISEELSGTKTATLTFSNTKLSADREFSATKHTATNGGFTASSGAFTTKYNHGSIAYTPAAGSPYTLTLPTKSGTLATLGDVDGKLDKTTYEWNFEKTFGSTGKLLIGKFPMYDSNVTVTIKAASSTTYYGVLVLRTQNVKYNATGSYTATVYGDASNTVAPSIYIERISGTNLFAIYFNPATYSKNLIHIQAVSLNTNAGYGDVAPPTDICTSVDSIPATATIKPTNALTSTFATPANIATAKEEVKSEILGGAPEQLNALNELAAALGNDPNFAATISAQLGAKYVKPSGGIPKTDLASDIQTSLGKADTALQGIDSALSDTSANAVQNKVVKGALDGKANKENGFFYVDSSSTTTAGTWLGTSDDITAYYTGLVIIYPIIKAGASTTTLNINGLGAKKCFFNNNSSLTTHYAVNSTVALVYDETLNSNAGGWKALADYDSTNVQNNRVYYGRFYNGANPLYSYKIGAEDTDGRFAPLSLESGTGPSKTPTSVDIRPDRFYYYQSTTTVAAGALIEHGTIYYTYGASTALYSFNSTLTAYNEIYLKGVYNEETGLFTLNSAGTAGSTAWYVFAPYKIADYAKTDYFEAGYQYIYLGRSYSSANYFYLYPTHQMYNFNGTNLVPYSKEVDSGGGVDYLDVTIASGSSFTMTSDDAAACYAKTKVLRVTDTSNNVYVFWDVKNAPLGPNPSYTFYNGSGATVTVMFVATTTATATLNLTGNKTTVDTSLFAKLADQNTWLNKQIFSGGINVANIYNTNNGTETTILSAGASAVNIGNTTQQATTINSKGWSAGGMYGTHYANGMIYRPSSTNLTVLHELMLPDKSGTLATLDDIAGGGGGTQTLTTQYVRVWDLAAGIYKWTYVGQKFAYYNGATSQTIGIFGTSYLDDIILIVRDYDSSSSTPYKFWHAYGAQGTDTNSCIIYYGSTSSTAGTFNNRNINNIPSSTVKYPAYSSSQYNVGFYYSTSNLTSLNTITYLYAGEYGIGLSTSGTVANGFPYVPTANRRAVIKTYNPYLGTGNATYAPVIKQELFVATDNRSFVRYVTYNGSTRTYGDWIETTPSASSGGTALYEHIVTVDLRGSSGHLSTTLGGDTSSDISLLTLKVISTKQEAYTTLSEVLEAHNSNIIPANGLFTYRDGSSTQYLAITVLWKPLSTWQVKTDGATMFTYVLSNTGLAATVTDNIRQIC